MRDFQISYLGCDSISNNDVSHPEFLRLSRLMKNLGLRRKSSKKFLKSAQVNASILNAIKQFKSADEMKRKKGNDINSPLKTVRGFLDIQESPE
jgi:hypothetical protein